MRVVVTRLVREPLWVLFKVQGLLGSSGDRWLVTATGRIARIVRVLGRRGQSWAATLELFQSWVEGDRDAVACALQRELPTAEGRRLVGLARLAVHVDLPELVVEVAGEEPPRAVRPVLAEALTRCGRYSDAVDLAAQWPNEELGRGVDDARGRLALLAIDPRPGDTAPQRAPTGGRILHLLNNSLPWVQAGYTLRSQNVARAQQAVGFEPIMITRLGFPLSHGVVRAATHQTIDGVAYLHPPDRMPRDLVDRHREQAAVLRRLIRELRPAAVQSTTPYESGLAAQAASRDEGLPFVYEMRGFLETTWLSRRNGNAAESDHYVGFRNAEARLAASADHVVTLGRAMRDDLVARGVDPAAVTIVPNAVDTDRFRPRGDGPWVRRELGIHDATHLVGYVGSLVEYEGLDVLLEAVAELRSAGVDVEILLVGDGTARAVLARQARELRIEEFVHMVGRVPHDAVARYYEAIDVFVTPRHDLPVCRLVTPMKPVEAMAMARPVVVSDLPALVDLIEDGAGRTFPAGSSHELSHVLGVLLEDPDLRRDMGRDARGGVQATRTWTANGARYRDVFWRLGVTAGAHE